MKNIFLFSGFLFSRVPMILVLISMPFFCKSQTSMNMSDYAKLGIKSTFNVDYIHGVNYADNKDKLDIFMPQGKEKFPVLIFFHGGALMEGDKDNEKDAPLQFVKQGIGLVIVNYRLSPGVMHPAHMNDAAASVAWVKKHISSYGGDPENVFLSGHSAGAYLAVLLSLDPAYLNKHQLTIDEIKGTIGVSPFLYVEETAKVRDKSVWGNDEKVWLQASVSPYVGPDKPPFILLYADGDEQWRKDQNHKFAKALKENGNTEIEIKEIPNRDHGSVWGDIDKPDDQVSNLIIQFIRKYSEKR